VFQGVATVISDALETIADSLGNKSHLVTDKQGPSIAEAIVELARQSGWMSLA
jgi:hypothetical protein